MKIFAMILLAALATSAFAADTTVKGHLVDLACANENTKKPKANFAEKHTKDCLLMDECADSGYGVLTSDNKLIKFDKAGNAEAKKFITSLKKDKDIKVAVSGNVNGESMSVSKIELQ